MHMPPGFAIPSSRAANINSVAEDVIVVEDDVPDVDADAKFDPDILWHVHILSGHAALYLHCAPRRIHRTGELNQHAVARGLYDAAPMRCDCGIDKRLSERLELGERAFFVSAHQKAVASDIRRQHSRLSTRFSVKRAA
jgi:hypothetical protein